MIFEGTSILPNLFMGQPHPLRSRVRAAEEGCDTCEVHAAFGYPTNLCNVCTEWYPADVPRFHFLRIVR